MDIVKISAASVHGVRRNKVVAVRIVEQNAEQVGSLGRTVIEHVIDGADDYLIVALLVIDDVTKAGGTEQTGRQYGKHDGCKTEC